MAKIPSEPYVPGNLPDTPEGLIQFLFDELPRIAIAINPFPVGVGVDQKATGVPIDTIPTEYRLFEAADPVVILRFDVPGGGWNATTGEWTCPITGLYTINLTSKVYPFGAGNKDYAVELGLYVNDVEAWAAADVGQDNFQLSAAIGVSGLLTKGDVLRGTITLVHDQFIGVTDVDSFMSIVNVAAQQ